MTPRLLTACAAAALTLAACGKTEPAAAPPPAEGVVRDTGPAPSASAAPAAVIQTQAGPSGAQVDLTRVKVTGDVLTVQLNYRGTQSFNSTFMIDDVSVVDDTTAQKYGVLKSADGAPMVSPVFMGNRINVVVPAGGSSVVWLKFPAPPPTSPTVSVNIPEVGPFDGVPVSR